MGDLMGGHHFEPGEIAGRIGIAVHRWREEDRGAVRRCGVFVHPADVFLHQGCGVSHLDGGAGQRTAVELHDPFDGVEFQ
jgi:hypothetical protein